MRVAIAGAVLLVVVAAGCGRKERPADEGFGAGAGNPSADTSMVRDTMVNPGIGRDSAYPMRDSAITDSTYRPH